MGDLVVLGDDGQVHVVDHRTGASTRLSEPAPGRSNTQPTWSADGGRVAWGQADDDGTYTTARLVVADPATGARTSHDITFPAFYLAWRPDGAAVAHLGAGPLGLELTVTDTATGTSEILLRGAPLYFAWAPDGAICAHVGPRGDDEVWLLRPGEPDRPLGPRPAVFTSPQWAPGGAEAIMAERMAARGEVAWLRVVAVDRDGHARPLAAGTGYASFALSPDGATLAHLSARRHALYVRDVATRDDVEVTADRVLAFEWAPARTALLVTEAGLLGASPVLRHRVWTPKGTATYAWFQPSPLVAREELPFAEQFSRHRTRWSPDATAFAYAGTGLDGRAGIWVQHTRAEAPVCVGPGASVSWRPGPAAP